MQSLAWCPLLNNRIHHLTIYTISSSYNLYVEEEVEKGNKIVEKTRKIRLCGGGVQMRVVIAGRSIRYIPM